MTTTPEDWIDRSILEGDRTVNGWRARIRTMPVREAMRQVPLDGLLQCGIPIDAFRQLQAHIRASGTTQAQWVREAVALRYLSEGGDPAVAHAAMIRPDRRTHRD